MNPRMECRSGFRSITVEVALLPEHIETAERIAALRGSTVPEEIDFAVKFGIFPHMENNLKIMEKSARMAREHRMRQEVSADGDSDEAGDPGRAGGDPR